MTDLSQLYDPPSDLARNKQLAHLDDHARNFIALSPFLVIASGGVDGADCSPRGDAPGFVQVLDAQTLLIPDRRGNNRLDTLQNVQARPEIGLLFFVPGINETLRINGRAEIVSDAALLAPLAAQGKIPGTALRVIVTQMYFHCGKALLRSKLWQPESQVPRSAFPSLGRVIADQVQGVDGAQADIYLEESYKNRLY
ncbi:pyridoxamine 5'-phosphate oxidase family protein [Ferrovibrio sp.]|uniref:pyridoxamine 5'-phosphate oxidase family protein n=1 Tax=Ferrovibrio sp. TaxID=1917215 RepID=UPI001B6B7A66|nr:pyridoxamine 5'-phosphate oxidase family protein [Ferrovibrio sp.]MBP7062780.1 pyridoxamine 5'-phosphate oxidase family protein [Ferrovibrio sp.]